MELPVHNRKDAVAARVNSLRIFEKKSAKSKREPLKSCMQPGPRPVILIQRASAFLQVQDKISQQALKMLLTVTLILLVAILILYLGTRKPKGYPPGPNWLPIFGSLLDVVRIRQETGYLFKTCTELGRRYGPVVGLKIGVDRIVILNDYESIKAMLSDEACDGRPIGPFFAARTWGERKGLLVVDGTLWIEQRRFVLRHLREFGFGRNSMAAIIEDEASKLVQHFQNLIANGYRDAANKENPAAARDDPSATRQGQIYRLQTLPKTIGKVLKSDRAMGDKNDACLLLQDNEGTENLHPRKPLKAADMYVKADEYPEVRKVSQTAGIIISMHDAFGVSVLNTLWRLMAGKRFNPDDRELTYLQRILTNLLREIDMIGAPFGHFPILRFVAPEKSGYNSFVETHRQLWQYLRAELNNHKNDFRPNAPRDLMDVYLEVLSSNDYGDTFSESQLLAICTDLFIAGSETTSKALGFCFLYLMLFPNVQKKAQEEIDRTVGRERLPSLSDRPRMTYMNAIVLESLRMFMGRTLNVPHRAMKDTVILGHRIPKDTMLVANFNRILMDDSWGDPETFRPERFIDSSGHISTPSTYFPFSTGRHRCMGELLARSNIFVITAALLQTFTFTSVPGERKPTTQDFVDGVTSGPKPFRVLLSLRA